MSISCNLKLIYQILYSVNSIGRISPRFISCSQVATHCFNLALHPFNRTSMSISLCEDPRVPFCISNSSIVSPCKRIRLYEAAFCIKYAYCNPTKLDKSSEYHILRTYCYTCRYLLMPSTGLSDNLILKQIRLLELSII